MVNYSTRGHSAEDLTAVFHALADPSRRRVVALLTHGPRKVTDLAASFPMSLAAVSKHLKVMERAGIIRRERKGRVHEMSLCPQTLEMGSEWLNWHRNFWKTNLKSLECICKTQQTGDPHEHDQHDPIQTQNEYRHRCAGVDCCHCRHICRGQ